MISNFSRLKPPFQKTSGVRDKKSPCYTRVIAKSCMNKVEEQRCSNGADLIQRQADPAESAEWVSAGVIICNGTSQTSEAFTRCPDDPVGNCHV